VAFGAHHRSLLRPPSIELTDDVADDWFLALWQQVPTPAIAAKGVMAKTGKA
jgi:hypothetical protein